MCWGVRSWDSIPSGAPVCEYIGLLMKTDDLDPAADNSYVYDIDCYICLQKMKALEGRKVNVSSLNLTLYSSLNVLFCNLKLLETNVI